MTFSDSNRRTIEERSNDPPEDDEERAHIEIWSSREADEPRKCPKCGSEIPVGDCTTCRFTKLSKDGREFSITPACLKRKKAMDFCYEPRGHEEKVKDGEG